MLFSQQNVYKIHQLREIEFVYFFLELVSARRTLPTESLRDIEQFHDGKFNLN